MASGKFNTVNKIAIEEVSESSATKQQPASRTNRMPTDFNLNIAESQGSIDFDISDSKNTFLHQFTAKDATGGGLLRVTGSIEDKPTIQRRSTYVEHMKKKMDEQQQQEDSQGEQIDSGDFHLSESNFSQSFRSKAHSIHNKSGQKQQQHTQQAEKKPFYFYEQQKFSSYNAGTAGTAGNNPNDLDDEF